MDWKLGRMAALVAATAMATTAWAQPVTPRQKVLYMVARAELASLTIKQQVEMGALTDALKTEMQGLEDLRANLDEALAQLKGKADATSAAKAYYIAGVACVEASRQSAMLRSQKCADAAEKKTALKLEIDLAGLK